MFAWNEKKKKLIIFLFASLFWANNFIFYYFEIKIKSDMFLVLSRKAFFSVQVTIRDEWLKNILTFPVISFSQRSNSQSDFLRSLFKMLVRQFFFRTISSTRCFRFQRKVKEIIIILFLKITEKSIWLVMKCQLINKSRFSVKINNKSPII